MKSDGTVGTGPGNTRSRSRAWCFTINNPTKWGYENHGTVAHDLELLECTRYVFQLEEGENETPHYQGVIYFKNPMSLSSLKDVFKKAHWERCMNWRKSIVYCSKEEGRIEGPWTKDCILPKKLKLITELRPWQNEIVSECESDPDDRTINWIWSEAGGEGKTALAKLLVVKYGAILVGGKSSDAKYAISEALKRGKEINIVIFLFPRSAEEYVSYDAIESIKDGIFFSSKYESASSVFNPPHVFIFCNFRPDYKKLSADRWKVRKLPKYPL